MRFFPELIHKFDTGLGIFESVFANRDGTKGVLNGPHELFATCRHGNDNVNLGNVSYFSSRMTSSPVIQEDTPLSRASGSHECVVLDSDLYSAHHAHSGDDGLKGLNDGVVSNSDMPSANHFGLDNGRSDPGCRFWTIVHYASFF